MWLCRWCVTINIAEAEKGLTEAMPIATGHRRTEARRVVSQSVVAVAWCVMVVALVLVGIRIGDFVGIGIAAAGGLVFVACRHQPRRALVLWMLSMTMIPIWVSAHLLANIPLYCVVAIMAVASVMTNTQSRFTFTVFDAYFSAVIAVSFLAVLFGGSNAAVWVQQPVRWGIPFLAARILVSATGTRFAVNAFAVIFAIVGGLAVVEFLFVWHPFVNWNTGTPEYALWHSIQTRGGSDRSTWAFGHSIALGGSLAFSIPFIARSTFTQNSKAVMFMLVGAGILTTASRGALVAAVLSAGICVVYLTQNRFIRTLNLVATLIVVYLMTSVFASFLESWVRGTDDEQQQSVDYRNSLYSTALPGVELFGRSPFHTRIISVDSAVVRLGLEFGWIFLIMILFPLILTTYRVVAGHATTAEIAIVGQIPLFAAVALITQYESIVFVVAGIAVQMIIEERTTAEAGCVSAAGPIPGPANNRRWSLHPSADG